MTSKILSGFVAVAYLVAAYLAGGGESAFKLALYLILPLACIWFSDAMGGYTGSSLGAQPSITESTPGCFVAFGGWLLLLLPLIAWVIVLNSSP